MKPFLPDDPKWTAFILNELSGEEHERVKAEIATNPEAARWVTELRGVTEKLNDMFPGESKIGLLEMQKARIQQAAKNRKGKRSLWMPILSAAALVMLCFGAAFQMFQDRIRGMLGGATTELGGDPGSSGSHTSVELMMLYAQDESSSLPLQSPVISPSQDDFEVLPRSGFQRVGDHPLSTFSIDVDTASYSVVRKMLNEGRLPPPDAVRVEEMINYFPYDYAPPVDGRPFAAHLEMAACPWQPRHQLLRVALKGREISADQRPGMNLVFLIDVSGSMEGPTRLPLVKRAMSALVKQLDERDRVAIVVYAGAAGVVLPPTSGDNTPVLLAALDNLQAGGSTAGAQGIQLAYNTARQSFDKERVNRVILCTDGDFNVGISSRGELERLIETEATSGVFLSVLGFGMGNYKDSTLELLSNKGNGNYAYIDDFSEARKVLVDQMLGTLVTIAKDVKVQVEFNPAQVAAYRLIGYENRRLKKEDFNNDTVDAGDIGAGHTVTAFYEIIPAGVPVPDAAPAVDPLKYQPAIDAERMADSGEMLTVKLRYKAPDGDTSEKLEFPFQPKQPENRETSGDFRFATAVAAFGQALRDPAFAQAYPLGHVLDLADSAARRDPGGHSAEFLRLVRNAMAIPGPESDK